MELTAPSLRVELMSASAKSAFTISYGTYVNKTRSCSRREGLLTWQLSKLPVTARLCTFLSSTVVICSSCMGLTRPLGCNMKTDTSFFPRSPYMAADPVSPLVAPTTVRWYLSKGWRLEQAVDKQHTEEALSTYLGRSCPRFS